EICDRMILLLCAALYASASRQYATHFLTSEITSALLAWVVLVLDAGREFVPVLLHGEQHFPERCLALSPRRVRTGFAGGRALAVLQVQAGDPVVIFHHRGHGRLAVHAIDMSPIQIQRGVRRSRQRLLEARFAALPVSVERDPEFALRGVLSYTLEQSVVIGQLHGDVVCAEVSPAFQMY